MSTENKFGWISLPPHPSICPMMTNLMEIDNSRFICLDEGILSFDVTKNEWSKLDMKDVKLPDASWNSVSSYNTNTKQIYILPSDGDSMSIYDMATNKLSNYPCNNEQGSLICVNSVCHNIGGWQSNYHKIWNDENKQFEQVHEFKEYPQGITSFGLIHDKKRENLLLFGGFESSINGGRLDDIHKYSLGTRIWTKLAVKLPHKLNLFGSVITKDQQYIIILGGYANIDARIDSNDLGVRRDEDFNHILILELRTMRFRESAIKLPFSGVTKAIIMNKKEENELLIHGYVKQNMNKFNTTMPFVLIKMMTIWHVTEFIHVINIQKKHWKINIDKIFESDE